MNVFVQNNRTAINIQEGRTLARSANRNVSVFIHTSQVLLRDCIPFVPATSSATNANVGIYIQKGATIRNHVRKVGMTFQASDVAMGI